ncbi:hypothetical protein [Streptomyces sp. NPDC018693]|uniref:hypothetical protein n=1 Tax=unclassified Streptomyces TaxID=2593676 RepID=UPI00379E7480
MSTPPQPPQPPGPQQPPGQPSGTPPQPSAYPYPNPQSPAGYPPPTAPPGGQNFYAQPTMVGQPGQPPVAHPYAQPGPYPEVLASPAGGGGSGGSGGAGRAVLWAVLGAVVASAAWAGGVFLLGGGVTGSADLRGYSAPENLCTTMDYSSFKEDYPEEDDDPTARAVKDPALDTSRCSLSLTADGSDSSDGYLYADVALHKETDPGPEFTATWKKYGEMYEDYKVTEVDGIGDEAYLVSDSSSETSRYSTLAVRDGWMTYSMSFSSYSYGDDDPEPPTQDEIAEWLKKDTKATLEKLK